MEKFDAIIIGFGKGGKTIAKKLGSEGKKIALIEKSAKMYGGTCINVGCIPSKALVTSAQFAAKNGNWSFEEKSAYYKKSIEQKRALTSMLRKKNYDMLNNIKNIEIIDGFASFISAKQISIDGNGKARELTAEKIYINTGSNPVIPKIEGINENPFVFFSEGMLDLDRLPKKLVIIGGGYIGLEFASMYASFGSEVTVLQDGKDFAAREDDDIAQAMKQVLEAQGINFIFGLTVKKVRADGTVVYEQDGIENAEEADAVLVATGRRPNTTGLRLDAAKITVNERGAVVVDENLQTTQSGVYAMGDVTGGLQFTYTSLDDFRVASSNGTYTTAMRKHVPYSVFMSTPFARVGMNEKEAQKNKIDYRVVKMPAAAIPKAQVLKKPDGLLKALIDKKSGKILGAMLLCEESYEMINTIKLAMDLGASYEVLRDMVFTHPTMSEALNDLFSM